MTQTPISIQQTFQSLPPFDQLPDAALKQLLQSAQPLKVPGRAAHLTPGSLNPAGRCGAGGAGQIIRV